MLCKEGTTMSLGNISTLMLYKKGLKALKALG